MINYGRQYIDKSDIKAVTKVLTGNWLTQGPQIENFEKALKLKFGAKHCVALSSGTAALHLAGLALGWKKGDVVLSSPMSFSAASNCILYSNATLYSSSSCSVFKAAAIKLSLIHIYEPTRLRRI